MQSVRIHPVDGRGGPPLSGRCLRASCTPLSFASAGYGPRNVKALEYASIFRGAFSFDLISQVWRGDDLELLEALEGLVRLGLLSALEDSEGKHCFTHGLLQRAVHEGISEKKRLLLHHEAGKALEPRFETDRVEVLDDLAYHFSNSDDVEKMTRYLTESGRWALRMQDFSRALQQFEAAIEKQAFSFDAPAAVSRGSVAHLDFLCAYAEALCGCDRFDQARSELDKAMAMGVCRDARPEGGRVENVGNMLFEFR